MAFFAKPRLAAGATDFLLLPSSSFKVTPGQEQLQVDVGVNETLCVTSRDHDFYQCHTSGGSGYVSVEGFVPATFPCTFMINDKLPAAAKIRARTAPNNIADTIVYLVPGAIFTVLSTEGDWLRILSHEFSGTVGYVLQKSGTNVLLAMPTPPKVFVVLDTSVDVAIFDAPGFDGRVIASVPAYALMGTVDPRRKNWALLNPTQFDDADLAEQLYTQQLWVAISDGAADYLHEVPPYELLLNRVTRRLPSDSPIRLRHYPDPDAPEKGQVITNEVFTTLLKRTGGWAFVAVEGLTGWVHDSILRILGDNEDATPLDSSLNGNDLDDTRTEYTSVSKYDRNHYVPDYEDDEAAAPIAQMPSSRGAGQTQVNFIEPQRSKSDYPKGPSNTNANDDTRSVKTTATRLISLLKKTPSN
jgi:SH3-like domain-containing protein